MHWTAELAQHAEVPGTSPGDLIPGSVIWKGKSIPDALLPLHKHCGASHTHQIKNRHKQTQILRARNVPETPD